MNKNQLKDAESTAGIYIVLMAIVLACTMLTSCGVVGDLSERVAQATADRTEVRNAPRDAEMYNQDQIDEMTLSECYEIIYDQD